VTPEIVTPEIPKMKMTSRIMKIMRIMMKIMRLEMKMKMKMRMRMEMGRRK
jgi:hypothetical protein